MAVVPADELDHLEFVSTLRDVRINELRAVEQLLGGGPLPADDSLEAARWAIAGGAPFGADLETIDNAIARWRSGAYRGIWQPRLPALTPEAERLIEIIDRRIRELQIGTVAL